MTELLPRRSPEELRRAVTTIDPNVRATASQLVEDVRREGEAALRRHAIEFDGLGEDTPLHLGRDALLAARDRISTEDRDVLERVAARVTAFAKAQRSCLVPLEADVAGGRAGHEVRAVENAGCYAPGGRYPLPSSVLMTACTARAAGVGHVAVASPYPNDIVLAAAAIAGADELLPVGGAHAIGALAFGVAASRAADVVVGPGNVYVTAAKQHIAGEVGIDMLAGPSELVVLADDSADPGLVVADLLAQAEHDLRARPILVTLAGDAWIERFDAELHEVLDELPTRAVAMSALADHGALVRCDDLSAACGLVDALAPEHLQLMVEDIAGARARLDHFGGLFVGGISAEVFGDYGIGPNHTLPTGGSARHTGGLSVFTFLRVRTWIDLDRVDPTVLDDTARLAEIEGLAGHALAARRRGT